MRRASIVVLTLALLLPVGLLAQEAAADPVDVPGLEGAARVDRDGNGIAHIRAGTRHDLFFLQGWVHADAAGEFGFGGGPANRYVSEPRAPGDVRASSSLPGGTSGVPGTPFYVNLLAGWLTNDTFQLEQGAAG